MANLLGVLTVEQGIIIIFYPTTLKLYVRNAKPHWVYKSAEYLVFEQLMEELWIYLLKIH